jgi:hypothetical protein
MEPDPIAAGRLGSRCENARLDGGLGTLRVLNEFDNLRQSRIASGAGYADGKRLVVAAAAAMVVSE